MVMLYARGRQAVGARGPNLKLPKSLRAEVLVLVTFTFSFGFSFSNTRVNTTFIRFIILNDT